MNVKELKEFLKDIDDDVEVTIKDEYYDDDTGLYLTDIFDVDKNKISLDKHLNRIVIELLWEFND